MPFTFAHPSVVLPFNYLSKKYVSISGLVIGSMTPDFEYFIRMRNNSVYSHTWTGIFWFDLPLALLACFVFHNIVRVPLIIHAPPVLKGRIVQYLTFNWNQYFSKFFPVVVYCILVGCASHLLLDWFTHTSADVLKHIPVLNRSEFVQQEGIKVYFMMTGVYSLTGMAAVGYAIWQLPAAHQTVRRKGGKTFWSLTCIFALLVYFTILLHRMKSIFHFQDYFGSAVSSFFIALITCSLYIHLKWRLQKGKG